MKAVTTYEAKDGSRFDVKSQCTAYEKLCTKIKSIMRPLGKRPDSCDFTNGGGYLQHTDKAVSMAKLQLMKLSMTFLEMTVPISFNMLGRYLSDSGYSALYDAWLRLYCTDTQQREWGQPYYAYNRGEGVQKEWKD